MTDYTISLTPEELDELEQCVKAEERISFTWLMDHGREKESRKLAVRNKYQNRIIGKIMDARRKVSEVKPAQDLRKRRDCFFHAMVTDCPGCGTMGAFKGRRYQPSGREVGKCERCGLVIDEEGNWSYGKT